MKLMVKDFLVSLTLDLVLLLFPVYYYTYGPNPGLYKKISYQTAEISQTKVQEVYQNVQIYPYKGPPQVMPSNHLILCRPLLFPPSIFSSVRVFSNESTLCIRWPKYWSFSFNISPSNEHLGLISFRIFWFDLCNPRDSQESSPTPQF